MFWFSIAVRALSDSSRPSDGDQRDREVARLAAGLCEGERSASSMSRWPAGRRTRGLARVDGQRVPLTVTDELPPLAAVPQPASDRARVARTARGPRSALAAHLRRLPV